MKKYLTLGILFILPLGVYMFFASGKDNFGKLPVLTESVKELTEFRTASGEPVLLKDHITVLGFFGKEPASLKANAFNLTHKIYKKNREFQDFQFVLLAVKGTESGANEILKEIEAITNTEQWIFAYGTEKAIQDVYESLGVNLTLDNNASSPLVFIIDRDVSLRGRDDDEDVGLLYGFDATNYAEINNKMHDDVKVVLAEYRRALKKYNADSRAEKIKNKG